jgi:hypothetical protein
VAVIGNHVTATRVSTAKARVVEEAVAKAVAPNPPGIVETTVILARGMVARTRALHHRRLRQRPRSQRVQTSRS